MCKISSGASSFNDAWIVALVNQEVKVRLVSVIRSCGFVDKSNSAPLEIRALTVAESG